MTVVNGWKRNLVSDRLELGDSYLLKHISETMYLNQQSLPELVDTVGKAAALVVTEANRLSEDTAKQLSLYLGTSPRYLMALQVRQDSTGAHSNAIG